MPVKEKGRGRDRKREIEAQRELVMAQKGPKKLACAYPYILWVPGAIIRCSNCANQEGLLFACT